MAKILLIDGENIKVIDKVKFTEEGKLQDYLEKYPSLIPLADIVEGASDLLCIGREVIAGPGWVDLLFIDKDGLLTVVETKLARNPEARRTVIGQIIEYASYIYKWTVDDVESTANDYFRSDRAPKKYRNKTLYEVIEQFSPEGSFSVDGFKTIVEKNLREGKIRLIIAVDELVEPLRATVTFLNSYSNFDILLLQVSSFEESETRKVLIPLLFGYKPSPPPSGGTRIQSNRKNFFEDARERCERDVVKAMEEVYEFTKENAVKIGWGTGAARRSFIFHGVKEGLSFFTLYSDGTIDNNVGWPETWKTIDYETLTDFWISELNRRLEINISKEEGTIAYIDDLVKRNKLKDFQEAVLALCRQIESSEQ